MKKLLTIGIILIVALAMVAMPATAMKPTVVHKASGSGSFIETNGDLNPGVLPFENEAVNFAFTAQQDSTGRKSGHTTITILSPGGFKWTFKGDVDLFFVFSGITSKIGMITGNITTSSLPYRQGEYYVLQFEDGQPDKAVISVFNSKQALIDWLNIPGNNLPVTIPLTSGSIAIV